MEGWEERERKEVIEKGEKTEQSKKIEPKK
jgi:hypothetical protein